MSRGPFLESPGNLPGPISKFLNVFFRRLQSNYRHGTWPMFSQNYKILKFNIQSYQKLTMVKKHLAPKTLIGPGKLPGLSRNEPLELTCNYQYSVILGQI